MDEVVCYGYCCVGMFLDLFEEHLGGFCLILLGGLRLYEWFVLIWLWSVSLWVVLPLLSCKDALSGIASWGEDFFLCLTHVLYVCLEAFPCITYTKRDVFMHFRRGRILDLNDRPPFILPRSYSFKLVIVSQNQKINSYVLGASMVSKSN